MNKLRARLREGADAAAREGRLPTAATVVRRGRRRRRRLLGATSLLVLALVAGMVGVGRLGGGPAPLTPAPTTRPVPTTRPAPASRPTTTPPRWIPSVTPLAIKAHPGPYPGPDPGGIVRDATSMVRGCHGRSRIRLWARTRGKVWLIPGKPTPPGQQRVCWAHAFMNQGGGGGLGLGLPRRVRPLEVIWAGGADGGNHLGVVSGTVTRRAVRLRVLFHRGPPLTLEPVDAGDGFPVSFFAGFYWEAGPGPPEGYLPVPAVAQVLAYDEAGRLVARCRIAFGPGHTC